MASVPHAGHSDAALELPVLTLAAHASYRCAHSGACCRSHWGIPVSASEYQGWLQEEAEGRLALDSHAGGRDTRQLPPGATGTVVVPTHDGTCVFYSTDQARCTIHRDLGEARLPSACRHFPRVCRLDSDATRVTFSHYCPTVASTLLDGIDLPMAVVSDPPSCPRHAVTEGLDTRPAGAPLLHPAMGLDHDSYLAIELAIVRGLTRVRAVEESIAILRLQVERLRIWKPGGTALLEAAAAAFSDESAEESEDATALAEAGAPASQSVALSLRELTWFNEVVRSIPPLARRPTLASDEGDDFAQWVAPEWPGLSGPVSRYLAAKTFGNWTAYLGCGLRTLLRSIDVALAALKVEIARACARDGRFATVDHVVEAARRADLLLVHLAQPHTLARLWSEAERDGASAAAWRRRRQPRSGG